MNIFR